ncbi:MAG: hypothetical protein ABI904_05515 [Chloroflexota bacterium]
MPEKQKARSSKANQTIIAVVAMLTQLALCNIFAGVDRQRSAKNADPAELQAAAPTLRATPAPAKACLTFIHKKNIGTKCITSTRSS